MPKSIKRRRRFVLRMWVCNRGVTNKTVWLCLLEFSAWPAVCRRRFLLEYGELPQLDQTSTGVQMIEVPKKIAMEVDWRVLLGKAERIP